MPDINLLPEEQRKKEESEKKAIAKKPPVFTFKLTRPQNDKQKSSFKKSSDTAPSLLVSKNPSTHDDKKDDDIKKADVSHGDLNFVPEDVPIRAKMVFQKEAEKISEKKETVVKKEPPRISGDVLGSAPQQKRKFEISPTLRKPELNDHKTEAPTKEPKVVFEKDTTKSAPTPPRPKKHKVSLWQRLSRWLSKFFQKPQKKVEAPKKESFLSAELKKYDTKPAVLKFEKDSQPSAPVNTTQAIPATKEDHTATVESKSKDGDSTFEPLTINLIPGELDKLPSLNVGKKFVLLLASLGVAILMVSGARVLISIYEHNIDNRVIDQNERIVNLQKQIQSYGGVVEDARKLEALITNIDSLLAEHYYWTKVLAAIEKYTIDDVYYDGFSAGIGGTLSFSATGRDYKTIARQIGALENATDFVTDFSISSGSATYDDNERIESVSFGVNLTLNPELFFIKFVKEAQ